MSETARLDLPFLVPGMTAKEVVHNEALAALSALVQPVIAGAPASSSAGFSIGDMVIVATGASGDFAGEDGNLALLEASGWRFTVPFSGLTVRSAVDGRLWHHDGNGWIEGIFEVSGLTVGGVQVIGAQQPAITDPSGGGASDTKARQAISEILTALRNHGIIAGAQ